jgi:leader peptidase (prepilin peptidase)/N-methyltransferase
VLSVALTAPLTVGIRLAVGEWGAVALFAAGGIPLAIVDARTHRLPNRGTIPLAAALLGYWGGLALTTGRWQLLVQAIVTAIIIIIIAIIIAIIGTLAAGDVKLIIAIGILTGWLSWMLPLYAIAAGYLLAVPHAAVILARRGRRDGTRLPFGPYLVAGTLLVTLLAITAR